ncbi:beta-lactamase family protein [Mitsuaria sp. WAJ17]|uniref:serine hydrolase domain-containing protein n=1 Tax=Mitsuaria sp. WAJ17 TaxID=2761452 RepID=UPI0015FED6C0|nr:serine hydrolase domain-containing protein [Mitsuaria sp. WAJ17]MBB2483718.1 beta-lactamase family protein [Mitsuaria sp. WAJ17]
MPDVSRILLLLLFSVICTSSQAFPQQPTDSRAGWPCVAGPEGKVRRARVEQGLLPSVVFAGEGRPAEVTQRMAGHRVPALSVAVIHQGRMDWSAAWGERWRGGPAVACNTLFQAGSLAKPVTVLAALRMKERGLIDLDADVNALLKSYHLPPGAQTEANPVTLRHLLRHTAGITPGGYDGYAQGQVLPSDLQTVNGTLPSNARKVEVQLAPGTALRYSGGGYTVAEIALQDRLGQPFERLMREWLLAPAGMRQADFTQPLPKAGKARAAHGHRSDGSEVPGAWHNHPEQAAAGLWATPSDMATFLIEIGKGYRGESRVFSAALVRELMSEPSEGHVYGFRLSSEGNQRFITHYGGTLGYRVGMTLNLDTGDGAVFMSNGDGGMDLGLEFLGAVSRTYGWPVFRELQVVRAVQPEATLRALAGRYVFAEQGWRISVVYEKDALTLVFPNGDRYAMAPVEGGPRDFIHPATRVRASFEGELSDPQLQLYGQTGRREAH